MLKSISLILLADGKRGGSLAQYGVILVERVE